MHPQIEAPLQSVAQHKLLSPQGARLLTPVMDTPPSLSTDGSSPEVDDDKTSTCSDKCSQTACSDCCESDQCSPECLPSCDGFVDCDDEDFCTDVDCVEDACVDTAPPCFDTGCLQTVQSAEYQGIERAQELSPWWDTTTGGQAFNRLVWATQSAAPIWHIGQNNSFAQHSPSRNTSTDSGFVTDSDSSHSPAKRRKVSTEFGQHSSLYMYAPTQQQQSIGTAGGHPTQCKWVQGGLQCDTTLDDWRALDYHVQEQHIKPQTSLHCQWNHCEEDIDSSALLSHVKRKHSPARDEHVCLWQGCDATFEDADDLDRHLKSGHVSNNELHCEWERCGATAVDPKDLSLHLQMDHLMDPGTISLDNTHASASLATYALPETNEKNVCEWMSDHGEVGCGMIFDSTGELQQHLKDYHLKMVTSKSDLVCRWKGCERGSEKPFSQKGKLERHFVTHTGYKPFKCDFCVQNFATFAAKEQHERTHTGERPFTCDQPNCGKSFATTTSLTMHKRHHTGEKPLKCPFCGEWFAESSNLSKHKKTHEEKGNHICDHPGCGKDFKRAARIVPQISVLTIII
ncbi:MAG: zinc-finger protein [Pleopsidium flavum]|nr:MAG: zinc-finger protein [Pleopsidium flavum]